MNIKGFWGKFSYDTRENYDLTPNCDPKLAPNVVTPNVHRCAL